eukprot:scaffold69300_cov73-Cyclotella_meneghiniana.AAC.5
MFRCIIYTVIYLLAFVVNPSAAQNRPRYNVYSLPPFEIKLDVDLWTTVLNGSYLNVRRLDALGTYFHDDYTIDASSNQQDPALALTELKMALGQATTHKDDATSAHLPSYLLALLTEYTNSYLTTFLHSAFDTDGRSEKGWSLVHAVDLRGEWVDITFRNSQVHYLEGEKDANAEDEETFASLTIAFSGTAAVLQGKNVDSYSDAAVDQNDLLRTSPRISRSLLRLGMNTAFSPPDGPYQFLSHVITNSMEDRLYSVADINMEKPQVMEHDAALVLSGGRDVQTRMDLDLFPTADFVSHDSIYVATGTNEQAEKRESIAVFFQGCYMVLFIGGFYIYASYRYRRNYLKWELERYGNKDAVLFTHKYKRQRGQKIVNFISGRQRNNRAKNNSSPVTVEIDGVDGFFERELSGVDSSDDDLETNLERQSFQYCEEPQDLEKGLRESYNESTRNKKGLDMNPIDEQSIGSGKRGTMKAIDDDIMPQSPTESASQPPQVDWDEVLENVVPIPASDAVGKLDDRNPTYHITNQDGTGILVQRRYVQPASPFDVLYGAAFLHGEADRVEAQRRLDKPKKKKIRASPSYNMRKKKKKTLTMKLVTDAMNGQKSKDSIRPMMTISEDNGIHEVFNEEEEDVSDVEEENSDTVQNLAQFTPGELRHNASPMSFYSPKNFLRNLSEKYNLGSLDQSAPNASGIEQEGQIIDEKKDCDDSVMQCDYPVEQGVVFCDFPRQDGTPCIIYDKDESGREQNVDGQSGSGQEHSVDGQSDSIFQESDGIESIKDKQNITVDLESDDEEQPDQFAAKMNLLLESKCEQIKERKAMELEMQARRRERDEQKRIAAEAK